MKDCDYRYTPELMLILNKTEFMDKEIADMFRKKTFDMFHPHTDPNRKGDL